MRTRSSTKEDQQLQNDTVGQKNSNNRIGSRGTLKCIPCRKSRKECEFLIVNTRCDCCVDLKTPCTPKLTAKQYADREPDFSQFPWNPIAIAPAARFKSPPQLENGLARSAAANVEVYALLQKRKDTLERRLRKMQCLSTGREAHGSQSCPAVAQQDTRGQAVVAHGDEGYITSYPTPD